MSIVDELVELHKLLQAGAVSQIEYEAVKKRLINNSAESSEIKRSLLNQKGAPSTWQIAGMAAAGTLGGRLIGDHLKNDHLQNQTLEAANANHTVNLSDTGAVEVQHISIDSSNNDVEITDIFFF